MFDELIAGFQDLVDGLKLLNKEKDDRILQLEAIVSEYRRSGKTAEPLRLIAPSPIPERICEEKTCGRPYIGGVHRHFCDDCIRKKVSKRNAAVALRARQKRKRKQEEESA